jgi:hypothetical protein
MDYRQERLLHLHRQRRAPAAPGSGAASGPPPAPPPCRDPVARNHKAVRHHLDPRMAAAKSSRSSQCTVALCPSSSPARASTQGPVSMPTTGARTPRHPPQVAPAGARRHLGLPADSPPPRQRIGAPRPPPARRMTASDNPQVRAPPPRRATPRASGTPRAPRCRLALRIGSSTEATSRIEACGSTSTASVSGRGTGQRSLRVRPCLFRKRPNRGPRKPASMGATNGGIDAADHEPRGLHHLCRHRIGRHAGPQPACAPLAQGSPKAPSRRPRRGRRWCIAMCATPKPAPRRATRRCTAN